MRLLIASLFAAVLAAQTYFPPGGGGGGGGTGTVTSVACGTWTASWLTCDFGGSTTITPVLVVGAATGQTTHKVMMTGAGTSFAPGSLTSADLPLSSMGVIAGGTWNATVVAGQYGGTGVANTGLTLTMGGNVTFSGAFNPTFVIPSSSSWTLPSGGGTFLVSGGPLGTPSSGTLTNATGLPPNGLTSKTITINGTGCDVGSSCTVAASGGNYNGFGMWSLTVPTSSTLTTWANQGGASLVSGTNFLAIAAPQNASYSLRVRTAACPAGFTAGTLDLYALILQTGPAASGTTWGGVEIDDGTKYALFHATTNGNSSAISTTTATTASGGSVADINTDTLNSGAASMIPVWWHIHDASGSLTVDYSYDGTGTPGTNGAWRRLTSSSNFSLASVTNCGIFANSQSTSPGGASTVALSFAFVASLTAQ